MSLKQSTAYNNNVKEHFEGIGGNKQDLIELYEKNLHFLTDANHLRDKAAAEIRFCFYGQIVPYEIEDDFKTISRNFNNLSNNQTLVRNENTLIRIDNVVSEKDGTRKEITFTNHKRKRKKIIIERSIDTNRGPLPSTTIEYEGKIYKPAKNHGDVGNHSIIQELHADKDIFTPMVNAGLMGPIDRLIRKNYYIIHDMTETYEDGSGDVFVGLKDLVLEKLKEEQVLGIIQEKSGLYTSKQIDFNKELVSFMEGKKENFDGATEKIFYCEAALNMYEDHHLCNGGILTAADVLAYQMGGFINEKKLVHFPSLVDSPKMSPTPLGRMPGSKDFFTKNNQLISRIVDEVKKNFDSLPSHQRLFFNKNKRLPYTLTKEFKQKNVERHLSIRSKKRVNTLYSERETLQTYYSNLTEI